VKPYQTVKARADMAKKSKVYVPCDICGEEATINIQSGFCEYTIKKGEYKLSHVEADGDINDHYCTKCNEQERNAK
jgi:RNase P subunit RPR2